MLGGVAGATGLGEAGGNIAEFVTGEALNAPVSITTTVPDDGYEYYQGYYVTDAWKVSPKLLANVGVRWELAGGVAGKTRSQFRAAGQSHQPAGQLREPGCGGTDATDGRIGGRQFT